MILTVRIYLARICFLFMFDSKELMLMFIDPVDLLINYINKSLLSNKFIKTIFS